MISRKARAALSRKRAADRQGKYATAYWVGYWAEGEANPYPPDTEQDAEWRRGRTERVAEAVERVDATLNARR